MLFLQYINHYILVMKQENHYQSVENKIRLPRKHNVSEDIKLFQPIRKNNQKEVYQLSEPLVIKTNELIQQLNVSFEVFDNPSQYQFTFPESFFPDVPQGERNNITYEQKIISQQENTFRDKLSEEQLQEIAQSGQFKVKSNIEYITLPYIWKINERLFWGRNKIELFWKSSLAFIFGGFYEAKLKCVQIIPNQFQRLLKIPKKIFSTIFGKKSLQKIITVDYNRQIFKDFWKKIMAQKYTQCEQWSSALWSYLYVHFDPEIRRPVQYMPNNDEFNQKKRQERSILTSKYSIDQDQSQKKIQKINQIHNKFNQQWGKLKKRVIIQISDQLQNVNNSVDKQSQEELFVKNQVKQANNDQKVLDLLAQKKFTLYVDYLQTKLPEENIPIQVIKSIVLILRLFRVINLKYVKRNKNLSIKRRQIEESIKKRHQIKSLYKPFFNKLVNQQVQKIEKALNEQLYNSLKNDISFTSKLNKNQQQAYRQYLQLRLNLSILVEAKKKQLPQYHIPSRTFISNYPLLPPYKIEKNSYQYYSLKRTSDDLTVDTRENFWKLRLYLMRIKTWTINCIVFLFYVSWKGPVGFRCLFGKEDFQYDMQIGYIDGIIIYKTRKTVWGTFNKVLDGLKLSRRNFQQTPDLGLLGKNVSRIFNYIECYIFRFIFVGLIITLIGYPILIIVCSITTLVLVVTFWAWIPVILAVCYLFNILIYQFQTAIIPDRLFRRTSPLLHVVIVIIKCIIITLLVIFKLILLMPIVSLFVISFCFLQKIFRICFDKFMLFLFRKVGRTPSRDTSIAKKISGPGMSKQFYMSINEEDVYVLIRSKLQQIYADKFNELIRQKIRQNTTKNQQVMTQILKPFNSYSNGIDYLNKNYNELFNNYNTQYYQYMARYPSNPYRVRFTQQEIDTYFENTVMIVKSFVEKQEIQKWIFERYQLYQDMYEDLTRSIWSDIFGIGEEILEPLEKLDVRFKLEDQYDNESENDLNIKMKKSVGSVMRALEGEVALNHNVQTTTPWKHNLLTRQRKVEQISEVLQYWSQNSQQHINLNLSRLETLFIPNLNINEIIISESESRQRSIKIHTNIVDL